MEDNSTYFTICFFTIGAGVVFILVALLTNVVRRIFITKGVVVQGFVFAVEPRTEVWVSIGNVDDSMRNRQKVTVRFSTKDKTWITADMDYSFANLTYRSGRRYKPGDKLLIIYKPENPYDFRIVPKRMGVTEQKMFGIAGIVFIAVGIYFLLTPP